ncbi:MAG: hypothetical protein JWP11_2436 [Frankiales bacterium]|nr:hypothetical protein [Frankiales bacterium]
MKTLPLAALSLALAATAACSSGSNAASPRVSPVPGVPTPSAATVPTAASSKAVAAAASRVPTAPSRGANPSAGSTRKPSSAAPRPTPPAPAIVSNADNGKTFTLVRGQRLRVDLQEGTWTDPASASATVLHRSSTRNDPGEARAVFVATAKGSTTVSATTTSSPRKTWSIRVVVR